MLYEDKDYFDPSSEEELTLAMSRTIEEVFDKKEGIFINSADFFKQSEGELVLWRRSLEESILIGQPRLVCSHCDQMVKLLGRRTERGKIAFFAHLHDSDECDIKTTGTPMSKEEILAKKYGKIQESERHLRLKKFIADMLSTTRSVGDGFCNVEIEKRVKSNLPYLNWRRPDVMAEFKGRKIVFELQLSTTFLGVVVDRDIFYRLNNYFIIWVFNFDDNKEYVNLENLMCKDIYYANKRNVFILDLEAQQKSKEEGKLFLKCRWLDKDNKFTEGVLVSIEDLSFDEEQCKPYYIDADEIFYKTHPYSRLQIKRLEHSRQEIVEALMARMNRKYEEQLRFEQQQQETITLMKKIGAKAEPFFKDGLYGYKYHDTVLVPPFYKYASEIGEDGYGHVSKARKYGLVNQFGMSIVPCLYKQIIPFGNGHFIVNQANLWKLWGREEPLRKVSTCDTWSFFILNENLSIARLKYETKALSGPDTSKEVDILIHKDGWCKFFKNFQTDLSDGVFCAHISSSYEHGRFEELGECEVDSQGIIYLPLNGSYRIAIDHNNTYGLADINYSLVIGFKYSSLIFAKNDYFIASNSNGTKGVITSQDTVLIPFEYTSIHKDSINNSWWIVCKNNKYGILNDTNEIVYPIEYGIINIESFNHSLRFVQKEGKWGILNNEHDVVIPITYDSLNSISGHTWIAEINSNYGIIEKNNVLIPLKYKKIKKLSEYIYNTNVSLYHLGKEKRELFNDFWYAESDGLFDIYDINYRNILPCSCSKIEALSDLYILVTLDDHKNGIIKFYEQDFIVRPEYDSINLRRDDNFLCKSNGYVSLISKNGSLLFSKKGLDMSDLISEMYILVRDSDGWSLYNILSGSLIFTGCSEYGVTVNDNGTIDLTKCSPDGYHNVRIDTNGNEIPVVTAIKSTSYLLSRFKNCIKIDDELGNTILPYGDYTYEVTNEQLIVKFSWNKIPIEEITHGEIHDLGNHLKKTSICGNYGIFLTNWKEPILPYVFSDIEMVGNRILATKNYKKGVYSTKGEIILYPIYSDIRVLSNGFFVCKYMEEHSRPVQRYGRYGWWTSNERYYTPKHFLMDCNGRSLLSNFCDIEIIGDYENDKLCVKHNEKVSYVDINGNLILEEVNYIDNERFVYQLFGKYGLKKQTEDLLKPLFNSITYSDDGNFIVNNGDSFILYNNNLNVLVKGANIKRICPNRYDVTQYYSHEIYDSSGTVIKSSFQGDIKVFQNGMLFITEKKRDKWVSSFVDSDMNPIYTLEDTISICGEFIDGKVEIKKGSENAFLSDKFEILPSVEESLPGQLVKFQIFGKWGLKRGQSIIHEPKYEELDYIPSVGYILRNTYSSLYDTEGNIIISEKKNYKKIKYVFCSKPMFFIVNHDGVGLCDSKGVEVITPEFDSMSVYQTNIRVKKKTDVSKTWRSHYVDLYGLYSPDGVCILPCKFTEVSSLNVNIHHGIGHHLNIYVKKDGSRINADRITIREDGCAIIEKEHKFGLLDEFGSELAPAVYQEMKCLDSKYVGRKGLIWYDVIDNTQLYIDKSGLTPLTDDLYLQEENKKIGIVNSDGVPLHPYVFDDVSLDSNHNVIGSIGSQSIDISILCKSSHPQVDDICIGRISNVVPYGLFINVDHLSAGLLHKSKLRGISPFNFNKGKYVIVKVLSIHNDGKVDYALY